MAAVSGSGMLAHLQHQQMLDSTDKGAIAPPLRTTAASTSSYASSPRNFPTDLTDSVTESITEEGGESGSDYFVEPVTPVSDRNSQDFTLQSQDLSELQTLQKFQTVGTPIASSPNKVPFPADSGLSSRRDSTTTFTTYTTTNTPKPADEEAVSTGTPLSRRTTRGSSSSFKRTMSSIFRRSTSQIAPKGSAIADGPPSTSNGGVPPPPASISGASEPAPHSHSRPGHSRRFSMARSSATTRSNSPPSPSSGLEMAPNARKAAPNGNGAVPTQNDFKKKNRASTGLTLRGRAVNFVGATVGRGNNAQTIRPRMSRRASSFDGGSRPQTPLATNHETQEEGMYPPERLPWPLPPDAGTGAKARRMSLSLPDDFTVDVAELQNEFEYQHKFLGRHGKHLGKGAASKVTLMMRKGNPEELYAVKEFRGKSRTESQSDYEKKIKSEFSIAKSLHHPNIVETIRLCTDHSRWNHVMEYCSEGDLFSLVQKGHTKGDDRKKDRLCLFKQLIQGIAYLHANGIAHRDIKLENLLITKDSKLKITDFGVSEVFCGTHPGVRESGGQCGRNMGDLRLCSPGICGSEPYIAPEVLAKKTRYDARALDVWSSAIVMIYMTFGGGIWSRAEKSPENMHYNKLVEGWEKWYAKHPDPDACISESDYPKCYALDVGVSPPALRRVLLQMLNPDPNKRIGIEEVLNNRWMKNVECCQLESYEDPTQLIDATRPDATKLNGNKKIFCHNHLPPKSTGTHSLGKMPGQPGY